jgi:hypothetical protein
MTLSIHDPLFYEWSLLMRKNHLAEKEIQQYEAMDSAEIGAVFHKLGVGKGAVLFFAVIQSYRIASRVANAAWSYVKSVDAQDEYNAKEEYASLERALNDYSPENFSPHRGDAIFAAECFEAFYNESVGKPTHEAEEILFRWTSKLHALAASKGTKRAWTIQDVIRDQAEAPFPCILSNGVIHIERGETFTPFCSTPTSQGVRSVAIPTCPQCRSLAGI